MAGWTTGDVLAFVLFIFVIGFIMGHAFGSAPKD